MGLESPNLNKTGTMVVEDNTTGLEYEGILFSETAPNGSWETGKQYNSANIPGPQFVITTEGEEINLNGNFTVKSIKDKDGNSVNTVDTKEYNYVTEDAGELASKTQQSKELIREINSRSVEASGGKSSNGSGDSSGNFNFSLPSWLEGSIYGIPYWLIGIAVLVVLYYIYETNNY
jgi:hypothetical protein